MWYKRIEVKSQGEGEKLLPLPPAPLVLLLPAFSGLFVGCFCSDSWILKLPLSSGGVSAGNGAERRELRTFTKEMTKWIANLGQCVWVPVQKESGSSTHLIAISEWEVVEADPSVEHCWWVLTNMLPVSHSDSLSLSHVPAKLKPIMFNNAHDTACGYFNSTPPNSFNFGNRAESTKVQSI